MKKRSEGFVGERLEMNQQKLDETKILEDFGERLYALHKQFMRVAPFGRAGSNAAFQRVVELFEALLLSWEVWLTIKLAEEGG